MGLKLVVRKTQFSYPSALHNKGPRSALVWRNETSHVFLFMRLVERERNSGQIAYTKMEGETKWTVLNICFNAS